MYLRQGYFYNGYFYIGNIIKDTMSCKYALDKNIPLEQLDETCVDLECKYYNMQSCSHARKECPCCEGEGHIEDCIGKHEYECDECRGSGEIINDESRPCDIELHDCNTNGGIIMIGDYKFNINDIREISRKCGNTSAMKYENIGNGYKLYYGGQPHFLIKIEELFDDDIQDN